MLTHQFVPLHILREVRHLEQAIFRWDLGSLVNGPRLGHSYPKGLSGSVAFWSL